MNKNIQILIILLIVFIILSAGFNIYQYQNIDKLFGKIDILEQEKNQLTDQINALSQEKVQLTNQASELNTKIDNIESKIKEYLRAEGKITIEGKNCEENYEFCLVNLIQKLTGTSGIDCSSIKDESCPLWCAAGADADCCEKKEGYIWIPGRGCYDATQI